nr:DsbA family protein [Deltaproteobacteria bacterium]
MPSRLLRLLRGLLGPCLVLGLTSAASCANKPLAPAPTEPATGSEWVEPPAPTPTVAAQPEPQGPLLLATDVDGRHDALIDGERVRAEYGPGDPWMGAEFPTVTMVVYFDYQCPYSRKLMTTLNELVGIYPRDVRVVFKHFPLPFHPQARPAAIASVAAMRQGRFWVMHDALFSEPKSLGPDTIRTHALRLALDIELFEAAIGDPDVGAFVDAEIARGQQLGVRGTPNTFINGRKVTGAQALASLRTEIDAE